MSWVGMFFGADGVLLPVRRRNTRYSPAVDRVSSHNLSNRSPSSTSLDGGSAMRYHDEMDA